MKEVLVGGDQFRMTNLVDDLFKRWLVVEVLERGRHGAVAHASDDAVADEFFLLVAVLTFLGNGMHIRDEVIDRFARLLSAVVELGTAVHFCLPGNKVSIKAVLHTLVECLVYLSLAE